MYISNHMNAINFWSLADFCQVLISYVGKGIDVGTKFVTGEARLEPPSVPCQGLYPWLTVLLLVVLLL